MLYQNYLLNYTQNNTMQLTDNSHWQGIVKAIHHDNNITEVTLEMAPNISVRAIASKLSVEAQRLEVGSIAVALINSTGVTLVID